MAIELNYRSNHLLLISRFIIKPLTKAPRLYRYWKNLNVNKAKVYIAELNTNRLVSSRVEVK